VEHVPSLKIKPVDTVGAGDTFCGYLAQGLDAGMEFATAVRRAAVAGALACLKPGAQPSIPLSEMSTPVSDLAQRRPTRSINSSKKRSASTP
jgi:sugar/nucleoside kinase (ribokinase family)